MVSMVCPGDNVTVSCSTNGSALQWRVNISLTPLHFINEGEQGIRIFTAASPETEQPIVINQTVFHFSKISSELSLASVVTIDNVTTSMNLTEIECARQGGLSSTTILIIDYSKIIISVHTVFFIEEDLSYNIT